VKQFGRPIVQDRFNTMLVGVFSAVALLLAVLGLYSVLSYTVAQRTTEIGVSVALGADSREVLRLIFSHGSKLALGRIGVGSIGSMALTRWIQTLLFGITATDPLTFAIAILVLAVAASLACWIPARRAMRVDPMIALRCQ
jgi:putative ABC transport system permease protein